MKLKDLLFMLIIIFVGFICYNMNRDGWGMGCFLGCIVLNIWYIEEFKKEED